jgi:hypothetical protein
MKKLLFPAIASVLVLAACSKEELPTQVAANTPPVVTGPSRGPVVDFNYVLTKDENGDYACPTPKVDCSKISPPPTGVLDPIDDAIANADVLDFFNTPGWEEDFPYLEDEAAVVDGLRQGTYTMVRRTNGENIFYIVVDAAAGESFEMNDVVYTTMVDASL